MKKIARFSFKFLSNKYALVATVFLVWMLFFDRNDLITQVKQKNKLNQMKQDQLYFTEEIHKDMSMLKEMMNNPKTLERFAREKYLMKKDNEDVFVFVAKKQ